MANMTFIDKYIIDGQKSNLSLNKFYDTILCANKPISNEETPINDLYRIPLYDIFLKYRKQFDIAVKSYYLPESLYYKPKMVSQSIYGTTEMWLALLRLNKMRNITEFKRSEILVYDEHVINDLITIFFKREEKI